MSGRFRWENIPRSYQQGLSNTGSENYGGPVVTAGGLVFIAATNHDRKIRAFDKSTGALLGEATMPSSGNATPAVYESMAGSSSPSRPAAASRPPADRVGSTSRTRCRSKINRTGFKTPVAQGFSPASRRP